MTKYWFAYHRPRDVDLGAAGLLLPVVRVLRAIPGSRSAYLPRILWPISAEGRRIWMAAWAIRIAALSLLLLDGRGERATGVALWIPVIWAAIALLQFLIARGRVDTTRYVEDYEAAEADAERKREAELVGKPNEPWMRWDKHRSDISKH